VSRFGFCHCWRHHAPLGGSLEGPGSLERGRRRSLIRAAVQHANGAVAPDGPVLSCRRRRAAHLQRYTGRARKTSDRFSSGPVEASRRVLRRLAPSPGSGNSRRPGQARAFRSRSWQRATKSASGCCERRGHSDQVGVWREASGSLGQRRVAGVWMAGIVPAFVRRAGLLGHRPSSPASGCSSSSPVSALRRQCAALAGASHVMALSGRLPWRSLIRGAV